QGRCASGSPGPRRLHHKLKLLLPAVAALGRAHVARPSATLRGSAQPSLIRSASLGKAVPATAVRVSRVLRPQNGRLLRTVTGTSRPNMRGGAFGGPTRIRFQVRVNGTSTWHLTASAARVGRKGRFSVRGEFTGAGTFDVRFRYLGGAWAPRQSKAL